MVEVGEPVPRLRLVDTELKTVKLQEAVRGRPTVLAFFPGAFTGVCTKEMCAFRDGLSRFERMNAALYAISVDGPFSNKVFREQNSINFPILSDVSKKAIKAFGIQFKNFAHVKGYTAAKRAIFIADSQGTIKYKWVTEDPTVEPKYDEIEGVLKTLT
jgi:glutaredoxin-dependent peroxiredoxin